MLRPKRMVTEFYCELCDVYTCSQLTLDTHYLGSKHKSKLWKAKEEPEARRFETDFYCELCDVYTSSNYTMDIHKKGNRHRSNYKRSREERELSSCLRSEDGQTQYVGIVESRGGFHCEICQIPCISISSVKAHIAGQRHLQNVSVAEGGGYLPSTRLEMMLKSCEDPVVGLESVIEYYNKRAPDLPRFYKCHACSERLRESEIMGHILSNAHRLAVLKEADWREMLRAEMLSGEELSSYLRHWASRAERKLGRGSPQLQTIELSHKTPSLVPTDEMASTSSLPERSWSSGLVNPSEREEEQEASPAWKRKNSDSPEARAQDPREDSYAKRMRPDSPPLNPQHLQLLPDNLCQVSTPQEQTRVWETFELFLQAVCDFKFRGLPHSSTKKLCSTLISSLKESAAMLKKDCTSQQNKEQANPRD